MFTGIIEAIGKIHSIENDGTNLRFWIESPISNELKIDQSVSNDGVCLTVDSLMENMHRVTAIEETLSKTNLHTWKKNGIVNLERCMQMNERLDGHIVQGHVDAVAKCIDVADKHGSWEFSFQIPAEFTHLIIEKGSVCINGISLTTFDISINTFKVAIIPYTFHHTNISTIKKNDIVNIEFDILGKYLSRFREVFQQNTFNSSQLA